MWNTPGERSILPEIAGSAMKNKLLGSGETRIKIGLVGAPGIDRSDKSPRTDQTIIHLCQDFRFITL